MKNILGYYLMPHPPIVIPSIGKGEEEKINKTSSACDSVGKEIAGSRPETIVIITPHATMFSDAIAISNEDRIRGDLSQFGCTNIKMDIQLDREFNDKLNLNCHLEGIPASFVDSALIRRYNHSFQLDHGSIVPLYFINKYYNDYKLVHITYSPVGNMNLYKFGMEIKRAANEIGRKIVIIASGDLSHALKEEGPYSYSPYGEKFDVSFLGDLERGDLKSLFNMDATMIEKALQCGLNSVNILLGSLEGTGFKGELLSYEGIFGVGYGVMRFKEEDKESSGLEILIKSNEEKLERKLKSGNPYTNLARESLNYYFKSGSILSDVSSLPSELLNSKHGVFVSLKKFGSLRGCIGTIYPSRNSVAEEIIRNAIKAAIEDPRFPPVHVEELSDIDISVDVLLDATKATFEELDPKKYGVIVTSKDKRGLLLPDLEGVDTSEKQLSIACEKAGIDIYDDFEIEKFEVIRYKEGE